VAALTIWAAAALFFDLPFGDGNLFGVFIYVAVLAGTIALVAERRRRPPGRSFSITCAA
jgi:hypothetical protein